MLLEGNALQIPLKDKSVDCCVTSPPYWGLRDYGTNGQLGLEPTPEEYVSNIVAVFREVWRVLRDDGTLWLNLGDSYAGHNAPGWRDGNEIKNGGVSNKNGVGYIPGLKPKDLIGIPWRVAFSLQADGWYLRSDIIWSKPNPMPESVTDRPTKAHEYLFLLSKSERYYYDADAIKEESVYPEDNRKSRSDNGQKRYPTENIAGIRQGSAIYESRNKRSVWTIPTQAYPEAHFATFPEKLIEPCILAGCPEGGIVFDPFVGSGTTIEVAERLQCQGVGMDLSRSYLTLARKRTAQNVIPFFIEAIA